MKKGHTKGRRFSLPLLIQPNTELNLLSPVQESAPSPLKRDTTLEEELQERHLKVARDVDSWVKKWRLQQEHIVSLRRQMTIKEEEHQARFETMSKEYMMQIRDLQSTLAKAVQHVERLSKDKLVLGTAYKQMLKNSVKEKSKLKFQIKGVQEELDEILKCKFELEENIERERKEKMEWSTACERVKSELEKYKLDTQTTISEYQQQLEQCEMRDDYNRRLLNAAVSKLKQRESPSSHSTHPADNNSPHTLKRSDSAYVLQDSMVSDTDTCFHAQSPDMRAVDSTSGWRMSDGFSVPLPLTETSAEDNPNDLYEAINSVPDIQTSLFNDQTRASGISAGDESSVHFNSPPPVYQNHTILRHTHPLLSGNFASDDHTSEVNDAFEPADRRMSAISDTYSEGGTHFGTRADGSNNDQQKHKRVKSKKQFRLNLFRKTKNHDLKRQVKHQEMT